MLRGQPVTWSRSGLLVSLGQRDTALDICHEAPQARLSGPIQLRELSIVEEVCGIVTLWVKYLRQRKPSGDDRPLWLRTWPRSQRYDSKHWSRERLLAKLRPANRKTAEAIAALVVSTR